MGKKSPALEFTQGFMEPLSGAIKAYADIAVAQANANAAIISAQQKTMQAAVQANAPILHELDRPFFSLKGKLGGGKKAPEFDLQLSVMDAYALGDLAERGYADMGQIADGDEPTNFSYGWDEVRTPRTQISGNPTALTAERKTIKGPAIDDRSIWQKIWEDPWITIG